ncbi:VanZ family protein [Halobacillus shinanisalinarum]|uniref:VanZ family protein n=1 Tax=Halobacillus shinanisalinarum TaxID=2932258 RepID=A0ABY4H3N3_9BACI|nr:VanZ family protein [Halobacillus shinanisalinarum]UOQ95068.1 VanZ family protein [Halobacillus shinanisalinarum]
MTINTFLESLHFIEFAVLYLFLVVALVVNGKFSKTTSYLAAGVAILYGFIDEIHQFYVVGRSFTIIDLVKNSVGVFVAWSFVHTIKFAQFVKNNKKYVRSETE